MGAARGSIWTRDAPVLTALFYAVPLAFTWGAIPAFFIAANLATSTFPYWVVALPIAVLVPSVLWLRPRISALLDLESLLWPKETSSVREILKDRTGVRYAIWGPGSFSAVYLGLHSMVFAGIGFPGLYLFVSPGMAGVEGRVLGGAMVLSAAAGFVAAAYFPSRRRLLRSALRRYVDSRGADRHALEAAAELLAPEILPRGRG